MLIPHGTMIALVDGRNFELYRNSGNESEPELESLDPPKLDEHDKSGGVHHRTTSANPSSHRLEEDAHAAAVTNWLNSQAVASKIDGLIVIADPRTLGEMRRHYHTRLQAALLRELAKDLTGSKPPEIIAALRAKN